SGSAQNGHGKNDTYTQRLTSAPDDPATSVHVALVTDGQTDIVADAGQGIVYAAIGGPRPVQLFTGNITLLGTSLSLAPDSDLESWIAGGFAAGVKIPIVRGGPPAADPHRPPPSLPAPTVP